MTITPNDVAVEIGRPTPLAADTEARFQSWIDQALFLIGRRYDVATLPSEDVDYVVLMAVAEHARHPDGATRVNVQVDDGAVSKEYEKGSSRVTIWPELWDILDGDADDSSAFSVQPYSAPDTPVAESWA